MGQLVFQATLGGQVNLVGPNTASTFNLNVPAVAGTLVTTGDTATVTSTMLASSLSLTTPNLGTPSAGVLTNATGLPLTTGVTGVLPQANGGTGTNTGYYGFKNRIINGAQVIDQRNSGAAVTVDGAATYITDRFIVQDFSDAVLSAQQVSDAPTGFVNSLKVTVTTADSSLSAGQGDRVNQRIEGYNIADLGWGSASASAITLSFWVKSTLTGTFGGSLENSATNRSYPFTYTISSASTWEQKSITISGDTSGTWEKTNGIGIIVNWGLGMGSTYSGTAGSWQAADYISATGAVSVVGTLNATWQVTGVQLEKGSTATSFDYRPYGTELQLCQRYLPCFTAQSGTVGSLPGMGTALGTNCVLIFNHPVPARVPGTGVVVSSNSHFNFSNNDGNSASTAVSFAAGSPSATQVSITVAVTRGVVTTPGWFYANNASAYLYVTGCEL